jgi:hypothetical protein
LSLGRVKNFQFSTSSRHALGSTEPPIQSVPGALSPGVKRPGREADHSPPASAERSIAQYDGMNVADELERNGRGLIEVIH